MRTLRSFTSKTKKSERPLWRRQTGRSLLFRVENLLSLPYIRVADLITIYVLSLLFVAVDIFVRSIIRTSFFCARVNHLAISFRVFVRRFEVSLSTGSMASLNAGESPRFGFGLSVLTTTTKESG